MFQLEFVGFAAVGSSPLHTLTAEHPALPAPARSRSRRRAASPITTETVLAMNHIRSILTLACLATLAAAAGAQGRPRPASASPTSCAPARASRRRPPRRAPPRRRAGQRSAEYIVALVNSEPITNTEVQTRVQRVLRRSSAEAERVPRAELTRLVLERLIAEKAQLQLAKETGIKVDDLAVDQAEQNVARQNQIERGRTAPPPRGRRHLAAGRSATTCATSSLLTRLREREVEAKVKVSDLEVDQFIREQQQRRQRRGAQNINIAHVLVAVPESASDGAGRDAAAARAGRARSAPAPARTSPSWRGNSPMRPTAPTAARWACAAPTAIRRCSSRRRSRLPVGGIAGPIRSGAGFHVLKVLAKSQPRRRRRGRHADPGAPHPAAHRRQAHHGAGASRSWPTSRSASRSRHGRFRRPGARQLAGRQRQGRRRPGLVAPRHVRARVRGGDEPAGAGPDQRSGGVALRRAPDPGAWSGAKPS